MEQHIVLRYSAERAILAWRKGIRLPHEGDRKDIFQPQNYSAWIWAQERT